MKIFSWAVMALGLIYYEPVYNAVSKYVGKDLMSKETSTTLGYLILSSLFTFVILTLFGP